MDIRGKLRSFTVWVIEILCQAFGTTLWIWALAFIEASPGAHNDVNLLKIIGISLFVLIEFALTGYLATTLLAALYLPRRREFLYPLNSAALYLIHSEIFFIAVGNRISDTHNLPLQIGGACVAFVVTLVGDHLRRSTILNKLV